LLAQYRSSRTSTTFRNAPKEFAAAEFRSQVADSGENVGGGVDGWKEINDTEINDTLDKLEVFRVLLRVRKVREPIRMELAN
jgi:hypothetical protein